MFKNIQNLVNVVYGSPYLELPKKAVTLNYKIRGILSKLIKNYCTGTKSEQNKNCSSCHTVVRSNLENTKNIMLSDVCNSIGNWKGLYENIFENINLRKSNILKNFLKIGSMYNCGRLALREPAPRTLP